MILLIVSGIFAEIDTLDTLKTVHFKAGHTLNFRDPKNDSNKIDWHIAAYISVIFDSLLGLEAELKGSYERDNGINYYSHAEKLSFNYGSVNYIKDTEDSIQLFSISAFYPFLKYFKAGFDLSWKHTNKEFGAYIGTKMKFVFLEIVFWDELRRIKGELEYKVTLGKRKIFTLGAKANALYLGGKEFDWNIGYLTEVNINL